jgi:NAD-dependent SIR2 family protein deacetylase
MELTGEVSRLLRNEQDALNYYNLIRLIQESNCSVFVGAGLSVHSGYPTSNELINYLAVEGKIDLAELNSLGDFTLKATQIKKAIEARGQNFFEILYRRFDERYFAINPTVPLYEDLVRIPFKSIITTNYDHCIEEAAGLQNIEFQQIQTYPIIKPNNLEAKRLYYIHGRIDHSDIPGSSESIVLTTDDYSNAYREESHLPVFINGLFESHNILFIGFGLEEPTLDKLLELSKKQKDFVKEFEDQHLYKIAILPMELKYVSEKLQTAEAIESYLESLAKRDQEMLRKYGVVVVRYRANQFHSEIKEIIKNIYATTKVSSTKVELDLENTRVRV